MDFQLIRQRRGSMSTISSGAFMSVSNRNASENARGGTAMKIDFQQSRVADDRGLRRQASWAKNKS